MIQITLDALCKKSVSVHTRKVMEVDGEEYALAPNAKGYVNSVEGREQLAGEVPEPYLSAVFAVWGDVPVIVEESDTGL